MNSKSKRLLSALLTTALIFGMFAAMPLTVSAADDALFQVTVQPIGATYLLNEPAVALSATFRTTDYPVDNITDDDLDYTDDDTVPEPLGPGQVPIINNIDGINTAEPPYDAIAIKFLDGDTPITAQWYWSDTDTTENRSNPIGPENPVEYNEYVEYTTTLVPPTDTVGVRYYFAVLSYAVWSDGTVTGSEEAVTDTARIEVIDPDREHSFAVSKADEDGNSLAGAILTLVPDRDYHSDMDESVLSHEQTTDTRGNAFFSATNGYYILSEERAPEGFNATDEKYYIQISADGVFIYDPTSATWEEYETVTFVNKEIPTLNKDDHFAFVQGYPDGTFMPEKNMTRAEAVIMFSRLLSESMVVTVDHRNNYYPDVDPSQWYANQVGYMQSLGVLADYSSDGNFRPNDPVTRAEFATLAAHFDNLTLSDKNAFSDVSTDHWAVKYINSAAAKGWIAGYPDGTFKPEAFITRAEVVTLVGRMLSRTADSTYLKDNAGSLPRTYADLDVSYWGYLAIMEASTGHEYDMDAIGEHWTNTYQ